MECKLKIGRREQRGQRGRDARERESASKPKSEQFNLASGSLFRVSGVRCTFAYSILYEKAQQTTKPHHTPHSTAHHRHTAPTPQTTHTQWASRQLVERWERGRSQLEKPSLLKRLGRPKHAPSVSNRNTALLSHLRPARTAPRGAPPARSLAPPATPAQGTAMPRTPPAARHTTAPSQRRRSCRTPHAASPHPAPPPDATRMHACTHARTHARTHGRTHARTHARAHARVHALPARRPPPAASRHYSDRFEVHTARLGQPLQPERSRRQPNSPVLR